MPETPGQKLSILRFLLMMIEKRLVADGTMSDGQLVITLHHPDKKLTWFEKDDPFWLAIRDLGNEYQITVLTEKPDLISENYRVSRKNLPILVEAANPTMYDWEKITLWIREGSLADEREVPIQIKQCFLS